MATVNLNGFEDLIRSTLKNAVDTFGFSGVLSLLADEASERADGEDEASQEILEAIETAHDVAMEIEEPDDAESEEEQEDDDDYEQEDYIVSPDDDEEEQDYAEHEN